MTDLISKLNSYNLFNYLFPGTVFAVAAERLTGFSLVQEDLFTAFFVYYFLGLVISRIGSLFLEPILHKIEFVKFASYEDYVRCSSTDSKLEVLSEANNMYRTIVSVFVSIGILKLLECMFIVLNAPSWVTPFCLYSFLLILFLFSYRKQTSYITQRICAKN